MDWNWKNVRDDSRDRLSLVPHFLRMWTHIDVRGRGAWTRSGASVVVASIKHHEFAGD
jgi:hypothetical protein